MEPSDNDALVMDVGSRLRVLRQERGKSMRALARRSGLSTNALSMIERGRTSPSVSTLYKLSEALEVPITAFFRIEPPRQSIVFLNPISIRGLSFHAGAGKGWGASLSSGVSSLSCLTWSQAPPAVRTV